MQVLRVGDKRCGVCGLVYPEWAIQPMIFDVGPVLTCPICVRVLYNELVPDWYKEKVMYRFQHWLNTEGGRWYVTHNTFLIVRHDVIDYHERNEREVKMVIHPVRVCYVSVFKPKRKPNTEGKGDGPENYAYGVTVMVPKDNAALSKTIFDAQKAAIKAGIEKAKFTIAQSKSPGFRKIIRDGDAEAEAGTRGPEFKGHWFFSANRNMDKGAPPIMARDEMGGLVPVLDEDQFYSGVWAAVDCNFYPYKRQQSGIAVGLNQCMKWKDDERLDGRLSAEQAFGELEPEAIASGDADASDFDGAPDGAF